MPSHSLELNDPKTLARLILALAIENGGELRFKGATYDSIDSGRILLVDYDKKKGQVILKASSNFGRAMQVQPESYAWVQPQTEAPLERARTKAAAQASRRALHSDEELAEMEENLTRNQQVARAVEEGKTPIRLRTIPPSKPQAN